MATSCRRPIAGTDNETLGNGDGSQTFQEFTLKQNPLTFVPATNPQGVNSTLAVYVNNVAWQETATLAALGPRDHGYVTQTADDGSTSVIFGDGIEGARLPTGFGNVQAIYRNGIGQAGNVDAGQITLLQTRPLNVNAVTNPLPATGGADRDTLDQARKNVPLSVMSLDRLVSLPDYADFALTFAGIGKAASARLSDGSRVVVHLTIAGAEDIPIAIPSDLYTNLVQAFQTNGDPCQPLQVAVRTLRVLVISAQVAILPAYLWEDVAARLRAALLATFVSIIEAWDSRYFKAKSSAPCKPSPAWPMSRCKCSTPWPKTPSPPTLPAWLPACSSRPSSRPCSPAESSAQPTIQRTAFSGGNGLFECHIARHTDFEPGAIMKNPDRLYQLLPAIYRQRDASQGYPLQALLRVVTEQVGVVEANISQLYENWFIETCEEWVVPYIGDLVGYQLLNDAGEPSSVTSARARQRERILIPRRDVANTIRARRRKGTAALLAELALDVAGWPALPVEFFKLLAWTQDLHTPLLNQPRYHRVRLGDTLAAVAARHHLPETELKWLNPAVPPNGALVAGTSLLLGWRAARGGSVDLRHCHPLEQINGPFDRTAHTVDLRRIDSHRSVGWHNLPGIGLFVWRLNNYSVGWQGTAAATAQPPTPSPVPALCVEEEGPQCYTFSVLGNDSALFSRPRRIPRRRIRFPN